MPPCAQEEDKISIDSEGYIIVAGDGACPEGQSDYRINRAGAGLFYGTNHSHNSDWEIQGPTQNAQRAEVEAAWRWASWAWDKQVCLTDSQQVHDTLEKIIGGEKIKVKKHRDLWRKIERSIRTKGEENFKVRKIKAHQTKKEKEGETSREQKLRHMNEGADLLAVKGAARHKVDRKTVEVRKEYIKMAQDVQKYLKNIVPPALMLCIELGRY